MDKATNPESDGPNSPLSKVPVEVRVTVGRARPTVRELLRLGQNDILPLDKRVNEPVDLYVGDKLIACGELEELDGDQEGQLAVRLTKVADIESDL